MLNAGNVASSRYTILGRKADVIAGAAYLTSCCPHLTDPGWAPSPGDSGTGFSSEETTPFNGNETMSSGEDMYELLCVPQGEASDELFPMFLDHLPSISTHQTPGEFAAPSPAFTMSPLTRSASRSVSLSLAQICPFESSSVDTGLIEDQHLNFFDTWSTSPGMPDSEISPSSDVASCAEAPEDITAASLTTSRDVTWTSPVERHPDGLDADRNPKFEVTSAASDSTDGSKPSRVRLVMEDPTIETTNAVVEVLLNAGSKVSMEADSRSIVTLHLEDVTTGTVHALLQVLFRRRTKIQLETNP